jgi:uncharacterized protein
MAITLYDATVRSFLQTLTGVEGVMAKGLEHCRAAGIDPAEIVSTRLIADMHPFSFQVVSIVHHSKSAIEACQAGAASTPPSFGDVTYQDLQAMVSDARKALEAVSPETVNAIEGRDVIFKVGEYAMPFLAEDFLMSFSLVNLHFHAATTYDILRMKGAPVGKRDYLGPMRLKRSA